MPWASRGAIWQSAWDVVIAPFGPVDFKEGYVGDILTSTVRVLVDLAFTLAYFCNSGVSGWLAEDLQVVGAAPCRLSSSVVVVVPLRSSFVFVSHPASLESISSHVRPSASGRRRFVRGGRSHRARHDALAAPRSGVANRARPPRSPRSVSQLDADPIGDSALFTWVVVPSLTVSPLWWRFLQCLHRSYYSRTRWPHLGNAGKYACALTVSLFGLYHPELRASPWWVAAFVGATCYQVLRLYATCSFPLFCFLLRASSRRRHGALFFSLFPRPPSRPSRRRDSASAAGVTTRPTQTRVCTVLCCAVGRSCIW